MYSAIDDGAPSRSSDRSVVLVAEWSAAVSIITRASPRVRDRVGRVVAAAGERELERPAVEGESFRHVPDANRWDHSPCGHERDSDSRHNLRRGAAWARWPSWSSKQCGRATHGSVGSTPAPLRQARVGLDACGRSPTRSRRTAGRCRPWRRRGSPVSRRTRCCASTATRRRSLPPTRARRRSPTRSPRSSAIRTAASPRCSTRSPSTPASRRSASCSERVPTICSCSADARSPGRATSCACSTSRRTRSSVWPRGSPVPTSATKARC